jgi:hypothetical protein
MPARWRGLAWAGCGPRPTGLNGGAVALYIGVLFLSSACLSVLSIHDWRTPALQRPNLSTAELSPAAAATTTLWCGIAWVLAVSVSNVNYYALLLLLLSGPTTAVAASHERPPGFSVRVAQR